MDPRTFNATRARLRRRALMGAALFGTVVAACDCPDAVRSAGPEIEVEPTLVVLEGVPNRVIAREIKVRNKGSAVLRFSPAPYFIESDDDGLEEYGISSRFVVDCDGSPRPETARDALAPQECAKLVFNYLPLNEGIDNAVLRIESNARNARVVDVEIQASALTPGIEVCALEGEDAIGCWAPDTGLYLDFGVIAPGSREVRTLVVRSVGTRTLQITETEMHGDIDFAFSPSPYAKELVSQAEDRIEIAFEPSVGGRRSGEFVIRSNDPDAPEVKVTLQGKGDGPGICLCVTRPDVPCVMASTLADFGETVTNTRGERVLHVSSCGTKDLLINAFELENDREAFGAATPTAPLLLKAAADGQDAERLEIPLTFVPPVLGDYAGKLNITSNAEDAQRSFIALKGKGVQHGCQMEVTQTMVDFGQVAMGIVARRDVIATNRGTDVCSVVEGSKVTKGGDERFTLESAPAAPHPVAPGETVRFEFGFAPQNPTGTSLGEAVLTYAPDSPGASTRTITIQLRGSSTGEQKCTLSVQPALSGNPRQGRITFGSVKLGGEKILPATIQNVGSKSCNISSWGIRSIFSGFCGPFVPCPDNSKDFSIVGTPKSILGPGEVTTVDVRFRPSTDEDFSVPSPLPGAPSPADVMLQVTLSDTDNFPETCMPNGTAPGCVTWKLSGRGVRADLVAVPGQVDFGLITLGCGSKAHKVTLYATGGANIQITSITTDPAGIFRAIHPTLPFLVSPGGSREISVRFVPPQGAPPQAHVGKLRIESDAGNSPVIEIPLKGQGTTQTTQTDTFVQTDKAKSDVLFVVDDSGSMSEEQKLLAGNAKRFLEVANALQTDYHVAVVTTDMRASNKSGRFQGNPKIVKPTTPPDTAANQFSETVRRLGTDGSADERGLEAMVAALSDPLLTDPATNDGFLRKDANLAVVIVSDEEDSSKGPVDFYVDFLRNIKGVHNARMVKMHAIVGDHSSSGKKHSGGGPGCTSSNGDAASGDRYVAVQRATGGLFQSICAPDWGNMAQNMGLDIFGGQAGYSLTRVLDPNKPFTVQVNGITSPQERWTYDANTNNIVFHEDYVPQPGATISVTYEAMCFAIN